MKIEIFQNWQSYRKVQGSSLYFTKTNYNITWWILVWDYLDNFCQRTKTFYAHPKLCSLRKYFLYQSKEATEDLENRMQNLELFC